MLRWNKYLDGEDFSIHFEDSLENGDFEMTNFGWDLPAGVTLADIDAAYGGDGDPDAVVIWRCADGRAAHGDNCWSVYRGDTCEFAHVPYEAAYRYAYGTWPPTDDTPFLPEFPDE